GRPPSRSLPPWDSRRPRDPRLRRLGSEPAIGFRAQRRRGGPPKGWAASAPDDGFAQCLASSACPAWASAGLTAGFGAGVSSSALVSGTAVCETSGAVD